MAELNPSRYRMQGVRLGGTPITKEEQLVPKDDATFVGPATLGRVEIGMMEDAFCAAPAEISELYGYGRRRLGSALLAYCSRIPNHPILNRLVGIDSSQSNWRKHLRETLAEFDQRGVMGAIEVVAGDILLLNELYELGLQPRPDGAFTLIRSVRPDWSSEAVLPICDLTAEHGDQFVHLVSTVFHMPADFVRHYTRFIERAGWSILGAFDGATLVAVGGLYLEDNHAYLCFGATHENYRGRGLQKALISKRIAKARDRRASFLSASVASEATGASGPSFRNLRQAGFRVAFERTLFFQPSS